MHRAFINTSLLLCSFECYWDVQTFFKEYGMGRTKKNLFIPSLSLWYAHLSKIIIFMNLLKIKLNKIEFEHSIRVNRWKLLPHKWIVAEKLHSRHSMAIDTLIFLIRVWWQKKLSRMSPGDVLNSLDKAAVQSDLSRVLPKSPSEMNGSSRHPPFLHFFLGCLNKMR